MTVTEDKLSAAIRSGKIENIYYFYGPETFLTKTYTDRIIKKTVGEDALDFNLVRISGNPEPDLLLDYVEGLPVFSDRKLVVINDFDVEKTDADTAARYGDIFGDIPDTTTVLINITGFDVNPKAAKTKKLIALIEKVGCVCFFDYMPQTKISELVIKKATKNGIVISKEDAMHLVELTLCNVSLVSEETAKLCSYVGTGGTISREIIDRLVTKQLDTSIYSLAAAITAKKAAEAFTILDELYAQRIEPVIIMSALSGAFVDYYRAKTGKALGATSNDVAERFNYPKNRVWAVGKSMNAVARLDAAYLRSCVEALYEADIKMKSTPVNSKTIIETAIVSIMEKK